MKHGIMAANECGFFAAQREYPTAESFAAEVNRYGESFYTAEDVEPAWMAWRCYGSDYVFGKMGRKRLMGWDVVPLASGRPKPRGAVLAWATKGLE